MTQAGATLLAHGDTKEVELDRLWEIETPEPTKTWTPVPHRIIPETLTQLIFEKGWDFANHDRPYRVAINDEGTRLFGVTEVKIPGIEDEDYGIAIGFRNSHNKTMAARIAIGQAVFVCDNMAFTGDIQIRRQHVGFVDVRAILTQAVDRIPEAAQSMNGWFGEMRQIPVERDRGVSLLASAVEAGALPLQDFMRARERYLNSFEGVDDVQIEHAGTLWAVYQSVTFQWKHRSMLQVPVYNDKLNTLMQAVMN